MDKAEAHKIFRYWQEYIESADRFSTLMMQPPPSFLPYPVAMLEEALNIVAKEYFDAGDRRTANEIQRLMVLHLSTKTDEEALKEMQRGLNVILSDPLLTKAVLENLRASQESWMEMRRTDGDRIELASRIRMPSANGMIGGRTLAVIGIGLYVLRVLASESDVNGSSLAPDALIFFSGTASLIYVIVAAVTLWKRGERRTAWALPITYLLAFATVFLTPNPSGINLILNTLKVVALLTYFYAVFLLFSSSHERQLAG